MYSNSQVAQRLGEPSKHYLNSSREIDSDSSGQTNGYASLITKAVVQKGRNIPYQRTPMNIYNTNQYDVCLFVCLSVCLFVCLFVCLQRRISLTAEPIGFSFTGQLLIGPWQVYNYFLVGWDTPNSPPQKKLLCILKVNTEVNRQIGSFQIMRNQRLRPQRPLGALKEGGVES